MHSNLNSNYATARAYYPNGVESVQHFPTYQEAREWCVLAWNGPVRPLRVTLTDRMSGTVFNIPNN